MFTHLHTKSHTTSCFLCTCGGDDGVTHQADAGTVASQHSDVVVLPACQVGEVAVGVVAVALGVVAEASPGVHRVRCGTTRRVPGDHGDSGLAVNSCGEVSGNAGRWGEGSGDGTLFSSAIVSSSKLVHVNATASCSKSKLHKVIDWGKTNLINLVLLDLVFHVKSENL